MLNPNIISDYINNPNWHQTETINCLLAQVTTPEVEATGEARYQLGYYDGTTGETIASRNHDYIRGYLAACENRLNSIKNNDQTPIK